MHRVKMPESFSDCPLEAADDAYAGARRINLPETGYVGGVHGHTVETCGKKASVLRYDMDFDYVFLVVGTRWDFVLFLVPWLSINGVRSFINQQLRLRLI